MKKFLSTAAALGLVTGLAATASALELKVDGVYQVDGYYINQGDGAAGGGGVFPFDDQFSQALRGADTDSDSWYWHTFRINPTLIVNDKVEVRGDLRLVDDDTVWGSQPDGDTGNLSDGKHIRMRKLWLVYDSPIGKWEIGRRPAGAWMNDFVNSSGAADRIMLWAPAMENFKAYAFLQKSFEKDGFDGTLENNDNDYYEVAAGYVAEGITAWLGAAWTDDNRNDIGPLGSEFDQYRIKGYGDFKLTDTFKVLGEFDYLFGETSFNSGAPDVDRDAWAGMLGVVGNFGDLSTTLAYFGISGQDDSNDSTAYSVGTGTGTDFEPLYILTGYEANVLNGDLGPNLVGTAARTSGVHAVMLLADFNASEDLTLHGGLAWAQADETDWFGPELDDEYGWEFDLGLAYKLYQNLTYEVHFGWWAVGDFAELGGATTTEDIYLLSHHLSMKF
ncbi:MAG: hypothetical protein SCH71_01655 [Desulfobulbaceae bacterium]|nr:hypothetical protein [Desulfobulbaceae bacterium]